MSIVPPDSQDGIRVPSDIACVVDISGSMGTEATIKNEKEKMESFGLTILDIVKHAVKTIIFNLEYYDRIAFITFNDRA